MREPMEPIETPNTGARCLLPGSPTARIDHALIVIPARDEAERLEPCLRSVLASSRTVADRSRVRVVVVDDASADGTAQFARLVLRSGGVDGEVVRTIAGRPSTARTLGVHVGSRRMPPSTTAVLSTDADCVVPEDWVRRHLDRLDDGAVAVAGIVSLEPDDDGRRIEQRWAADYHEQVTDHWHPHVHAANLSIRLDAYRAAGGFGDAGRAEDIDLWRRVRAAGVEPVQDRRNVVATSARTTGRAVGGFACALREKYGSVPA